MATSRKKTGAVVGGVVALSVLLLLLLASGSTAASSPPSEGEGDEGATPSPAPAPVSTKGAKGGKKGSAKSDQAATEEKAVKKAELSLEIDLKVGQDPAAAATSASVAYHAHGGADATMAYYAFRLAEEAFHILLARLRPADALATNYFYNQQETQEARDGAVAVYQALGGFHETEIARVRTFVADEKDQSPLA